jgi:hypothetical protein
MRNEEQRKLGKQDEMNWVRFEVMTIDVNKLEL